MARLLCTSEAAATQAMSLSAPIVIDPPSSISVSRRPRAAADPPELNSRVDELLPHRWQLVA
jgi:hypothetical protein